MGQVFPELGKVVDKPPMMRGEWEEYGGAGELFKRSWEVPMDRMGTQ